MLAFNLAARSRADEAEYDRIAKAPRIMPAAKVHQNFEQTQAYARDLMIRQVVGDAMNLSVTCLNNAHLFLALAKANQDLPGEHDKIQAQAQEAQQAFVKASLDQKFDQLEKEYDIRCELEDTLTSLGFVAQGFMRQKSNVEAQQTDQNGELVIELKAVDQGYTPVGDQQPVEPPMVEIRKVFREGEKIFFTDQELQLVLVTIAAFAHSLFGSVARFARQAKDG